MAGGSGCPAGSGGVSGLSPAPLAPKFSALAGELPRAPEGSRQRPEPQSPGRQPTDLNAFFRVALLPLFTLLNTPGIHLQPVLTRGIPRHCRHCGVSLPSWGSAQWISPWVLLSNTFSKVGETWRETHCQAQVRHACNPPPVSRALKEHLLLRSRRENRSQFCFLKQQRGALPRYTASVCCAPSLPAAMVSPSTGSIYLIMFSPNQ